MPVIELTDDQVIQLMSQLSAEQKQYAMRTLARQVAAGETQRMQIVEHRLREIASDRGLDWDKLSDEERLDLADRLIHEDRECGL